MYRSIFSSRAEKAFLKLDQRFAKKVAAVIRKFEDNPRIYGTIKLENAPVASYRFRVGDFRILFDIDDEKKAVEVLDIRKRDEKTYK